MRVSVVIPHGCRDRAADVAAFARHVEAAGLDGVFVGDHLAGTVPIADSTISDAGRARSADPRRAGRRAPAPGAPGP
jgi:alkanesulfonate monooxygenase SsuD/methylene tetrahydromethanopterin reductase-like flavin-dependent oxidoreductase (luciferase family)